jgi:hypothetical protein
MADVIEKSLINDDEHNNRSQLKSQMLSFQQMLIHDIDNTPIFMHKPLPTECLPLVITTQHLENFHGRSCHSYLKSNPFYENYFKHIAGYDLDTRLV